MLEANVDFGLILYHIVNLRNHCECFPSILIVIFFISYLILVKKQVNAENWPTLISEGMSEYKYQIVECPVLSIL